MIEDEGILVLRKVRHQDPLDSVYGILEPNKRTDELIDELRGPAELP